MLSRLKIPIALAIALAAVAWLAARGVARNDMYVSTLAQWDPARARRERVRVMGFVKEGSVDERADELVTDFVVRDDTGTRTLPVRYHGVLPDMFRGGASVIAAGRLDDAGAFAADDLMTKCPSKYEGMPSPHDGAAVPSKAVASQEPVVTGT